MRKRPKIARQVKEEVDLFLVVAKWCRTIVQLAIAAFIISLGYILYGIFSGHLNQAVSPRIINNLKVMGEVLTAASFLGAASFTILTISEVAYSVVIGIVGLAIMLGMPILVANNIATGGSKEAVLVVNEWTKDAGIAILVVVGLRILFEIVQQVRLAGVKRQEREERGVERGLKKVRKPVGAGVWDPCWRLPYCHDAVREHCPAFKARKACWRYGYGCNCDPRLIESLIRAGGLDSAKGAATPSSKQRANRAAYVRSDLQADAPLKPAERTMPCTKCPIYLDHQRQKFKIVNPIAIVATAVALAIAYKPLIKVYTLVVEGIAHLASKFTYGGGNAGQWFSYLDTSGLKVFFFIIVGLIALAYVLKAVEWVIFEKKL